MAVAKSGTSTVLFSGSGGGSCGFEGAGLEVSIAANHSDDAIASHAANHPKTEHLRVDLLKYDIAKLRPTEVAQMSPSCTFHSRAQGKKIVGDPSKMIEKLMSGQEVPAYSSGYDHSDRSRVTMFCVVRYLDVHRPAMVFVENVPEVVAWGPNRDGTIYREWKRAIENLGYTVTTTCLNSQAFAAPQDRNRYFAVIARKGIRTPDLTHRATAWCASCEKTVEAVQTFRTPTAAWRGETQWGMLGRQYNYCCPSCAKVADLMVTPTASVIDWTNLGHRLGDNPKVANTMERIERGVDRFGGALPRVLHTLPGADKVPAGAAGMLVVSAGNTHERPGSTCRTRSVNEPCWTQHRTPAFSIVIDPTMGAMWMKQNGGPGDTAPHSFAEPMGTMTTKDSTGLVLQPWHGPVESINDLHYRRLTADEVRAIMGFPEGYKFVNSRGEELADTRKIALLGDGVVPAVQTWVTNQGLASFAAAA